MAVALAGCSTARTKFNDPVMRLIVAPEGLNEENYTKVSLALMNTGKFRILDRGLGYEALKNEQDRQHKNESDRYESTEKWALYAKLHGAGGVALATQVCQRSNSFWTDIYYLKCIQIIRIINASTSEIISIVENKVEGKAGECSLGVSWEETAWKLADSFPEQFEKNKDSDELNAYRKIAEESAAKVKPVSEDKDKE